MSMGRAGYFEWYYVSSHYNVRCCTQVFKKYSNCTLHVHDSEKLKYKHVQLKHVFSLSTNQSAPRGPILIIMLIKYVRAQLYNSKVYQSVYLPPRYNK